MLTVRLALSGVSELCRASASLLFGLAESLPFATAVPLFASSAINSHLVPLVFALILCATATSSSTDVGDDAVPRSPPFSARGSPSGSSEAARRRAPPAVALLERFASAAQRRLSAVGAHASRGRR
jgi:hypothetical protein